MPINFKGITTTGGRAYDDKMILRLNDSLSEIPLKQRAAILGSIIEESGGNPLAKSENGTYQGLLQWGDDRYRIKSNDREKELVNQLNLIRSTIDNVTDKKSWTHGGEGSGYQRLTDAHNAFADTTNTLPDIFRGFSFGYVRPKGKEASYNNRLKVAQQVLDRLEAAESVSPKTTVSVEHVEVPDAINAFRPDNVYKPSLGNILTALDVKKSLYNLDKKLSWENQPASLHFVPSGQKDYTAHGEGGSLKTKKWEELSIPEKAEMMRIAIENGITNLSDIKKKYNEFAEGGNLYPNGGLIGSLPAMPITMLPKAVDAIRNRFYRTINPLTDYNISSNLKQFVKGETMNYGDIQTDPSGKKYVEFMDGAIDPEVVDDIFATYLQIPEEKRRFKKRLEKSSYKPSMGGKDDITYYKLPLNKDDIEGLVENTNDLPIGKNKVHVDSSFEYFNLAEHTLGRGRDKEGREYRSYYDRWDINPFQGKYQGTRIPLLEGLDDATLGIGNPVEIYDRVYLDDYYGLPKSKGYTTYLRELDVTPKDRVTMWDKEFGRKKPK